MQKLLERKTYTPKSTPHALGSVSPCLNSSLAETTVMQASKTSDNSPDEAPTPRAQGGQDLRVPVVYVLNMRGDPLMPTTPKKAKTLLNKGEAHVITRTPFTIKLNKPTGETTQEVTLGVDAGYSNVGLSAITDKKEVHSSEVRLRIDMVKLNSERSMYRRTRRNRKTWYRQPRFLNRSKREGWLAPSLQHKLDTHIKLVQNMAKVLPFSKVIVEIASFDIQKIMNPDITNKEYQQGEQLDFYNVREYVFHRDNHTCQHCKGKSKDPVLVVHHIITRQTGGSRPENLVTLCKECHNKHHLGLIVLKVKKSKGFKEATFMSLIKSRVVDKLKELGFKVTSTYGYITKYNREALGLKKSHINDAFVIAGGNTQKRCDEHLVKQVRKQNRKLFKGSRSHLRNTAPKFVKGFQRYDKVLYGKLECFVFGRRKTGYFNVRLLDGTVIRSSVSYKKLKLLESSRTLLKERKECHFSSTGIKIP
ncbi:hypothetical protein LCGC14_1764500 [marine sediment metagenome]|uniref:HNH nuclease domain-containing protein n=1 Tax=marine sediment metagenome TaxID=412755 RepID=A0A0F9H010_9ZZZZ